MQRRIEDLERKIQMLENKIQHLIMPMAQAETTNETAGTAKVNFNAVGGDTASQTPIQQSYGFWSRPLLGALHVIANMAGLSGRGISIASTDERYRPLDLKEGDVTLCDSKNQRVWLTNGNTINITADAFINIVAANKIQITCPDVEVAASTKVVITCPDTQMTGNLTVAGDILDKSGSQSHSVRNMREIFDTHTHGGIQGGSGHTAVPDQLE